MNTVIREQFRSDIPLVASPLIRVSYGLNVADTDKNKCYFSVFFLFSSGEIGCRLADHLFDKTSNWADIKSTMMSSIHHISEQTEKAHDVSPFQTHLETFLENCRGQILAQIEALHFDD